MPPPPKQKLSSAQVADLEAWIKLGAPDPRTAVKSKVALISTVDKVWREHRRRSQVLVVATGQGSTSAAGEEHCLAVHNSIDHFILSRLSRLQGQPAPQAAVLNVVASCLAFDLTGLPPTLKEMDEFLADDSPQAFAQVVDRLLASPRYGERWGRHWLDVVRYADTCGNSSDYPVPQAHKYRDWVIGAFNRDLPYDQFLREQLAGDLLPSTTDAQRYERIVATGYLAIARRFGGNRKGEVHLTIEDTIDNIGRAMLGSSISCARCHDHKYDPFTMSDYYGMYGIFSSTRYPFSGAEVVKQQEDFAPGRIKSAGRSAILQPYRE